MWVITMYARVHEFIPSTRHQGSVQGWRSANPWLPSSRPGPADRNFFTFEVDRDLLFASWTSFTPLLYRDLQRLISRSGAQERDEEFAKIFGRFVTLEGR